MSNKPDTKPTIPSTPRPAKPKRARVLSADTVITLRTSLSGGEAVAVVRREVAEYARSTAARLGVKCAIVNKEPTAPMVDVDAEPSGGES